MKIKIILLFLIPAAILLGQVNSKTGTTAAAFLEIPVGAKAVGMGGAFVSLSIDATSLYWNPAAISNLQNSQLTVAHTDWIAETDFDYAALVINLGTFGTLGLSFNSLSMPDMKVRTVEQPEGTGELFSAGDLAIGLSYARQISDRFSVGMTAKFIQQKIWHESAIGFAIDAGTIFRTDLLNGMVIGASISNFGTSMKMAGRDTRIFGRVDPNKQGSNERIPFEIQMDSWDLPLYIQLGVSTNVLQGDDYRWLIAIDALHPNNSYESLNLGTEITYKEIIFLRGGWQSLFITARERADAEGGLSFGFGASTKDLFSQASVDFDYAYRDFGRLENIHVFSVGLRF